MNDFTYVSRTDKDFKKGDILANRIVVDVWIDINGKVQYSSKKLSRIPIIKDIQKWFYKTL